MVAWWWLIVILFGGFLIGVFLMGLMMAAAYEPKMPGTDRSISLVDGLKESLKEEEEK